MKTKVQISFAVTAKINFAVTAKLICVFVFAYAKSRFSHNEAHVCVGGRQVDIERVGSSLEVGGQHIA